MSWLVQFCQGHADFFNRNKSKNMTDETVKYSTTKTQLLYESIGHKPIPTVPLDFPCNPHHTHTVLCLVALLLHTFRI